MSTTEVFLQAKTLSNLIAKLESLRKEFGNLPLATLTDRGVDVRHGAVCYVHEVQANNTVQIHLIFGIDPKDIVHETSALLYRSDIV